MSACVLSRFNSSYDHNLSNLVWLFVTLWTVAGQARLSMGFSRQEYWSRFPCPPSGNLPNPGIEHMSLKSLALADRFFTTSATWEAQNNVSVCVLVAQ